MPNSKSSSKKVQKININRQNEKEDKKDNKNNEKKMKIIQRKLKKYCGIAIQLKADLVIKNKKKMTF